MLVAYFDASGRPTSGEPPSLFIAGFAATEESWHGFQESWEAVLAKHRISRPFHATDFFSGTKGFEHFKDNPEARICFLREATATIKKYSMASFSSGVYLHVLEEIKDMYVLPGHERYAYALCGLNVIGKVERWLAKCGHASIRYVFEDGDADKGELIDICKSVANASETPLPVSFEKKNLAALQAADLLAWLSTNWTTKVERMVSKGAIAGTVDPPLGLEMLAEELGHDHWGIITRDDLAEFCKRRGFDRRSV